VGACSALGFMSWAIAPTISGIEDLLTTEDPGTGLEITGTCQGLRMPCEQNRLLLDRRKFLTNGSMALAAIANSLLVSARRLAWGLPTTAETVEVKTAYGRLRGTRKGDLITFKGIPYAGPVSGENRFKAPPPLVPWTGLRDAFTPGPPSFQPNRPSFGVDEPVPSENCLVLNIWTPAVDQRRRPVMFYNHGGGFVVGSGSTWYQDGSTMLSLKSRLDKELGADASNELNARLCFTLAFSV
jgi:hypothetical protein